MVRRAGFSWFWVVSDGFGWFRVIPFFSNNGLSHWSDLVLDVGLLLACLGIKSNRITWLLNDWLNDWFSFLVTSLLHTVQFI